MSRADEYIGSSGRVKWAQLALAVFGATFITIAAGVQSVLISVISAVGEIRDQLFRLTRWLIEDVLGIPSMAVSAGGTETAAWMELFGPFAAPVSIAIVIAGFGLGIWVRDNA